MAPTLYMIPYSPSVRSVLLCAKALEVEFEHKIINLTEQDHLKPEYLKLNPEHTVPTLVEEDGFTLWDSHAIMPYLVEKYGKDTSLYPIDIRERARVNQRLHFDSSTLFPRGVGITKRIIYQGEKTISQDASDLLNEAYGLVEKFLEKNNYTAGDTVTIADFAIAATLTTWDVLVPVEREKYPRVLDWLKRMESVPYFDQINRPGVEMYRSLIQARLSQ